LDIFILSQWPIAIMKIFDNIKLSLLVLRANKARSFLTSLGIIIGIASVIVIMSVGAGAQSLIVNQLNAMGTNLIGVLPGTSDEEGPPASIFGIALTSLKYEDALAIKRQVNNVTAVSSYNSGVGTVSYLSNSLSVNFYGVMADYINVEDTEVVLGRFFTEEEEMANARVVVLGYQIWQDLFNGQDPIGRRIKIKKEIFEVVGVMKQRGATGFQNQDNQVLVPVSAAQNIILGINHVNSIRVKVNQADNLDQAVEEITMLLRDRHNIDNPSEDDFSVRNTKEALDILLSVTDALKFFLVAIASISLLVGGIGVMNIMLAAVNERIREVGLRKAVGACYSHIMWQFISETVAITIMGGIIGIVLGWLISAVVALIARYLGFRWDLVITPSSILLGLGVAVIVGLIFGLYPARKAARLDPISALRYE